jgi:hypothetical protein
MVKLFGTTHGASMRIMVSVEGFFIALDENANESINLRVPAFPLDMFRALETIMRGKDYASFCCGKLEAVGQFSVVPAEEGQTEKFVLFTLSAKDGEQTVAIKLRETEVVKFHDVLEEYWTWGA